jgi:uncharacterized protein (DUF2236 family)
MRAPRTEAPIAAATPAPEGGGALAAGYFSPADAIWSISRENSLMVGGGRALLMQVAHPLIAAGVSEHSGYREDPWQRLERTMSAVWAVVFGSRAEADRAAARVRAVHRRVRGRLAEAAGPFPAGAPYSAEDPELLLWVHATLVDTALLVYRTWVGPLIEREQRAYYEDMKTVGMLFGVPPAVIPRTLDDFRDYMAERLASNDVQVTAAARDVCRSVLDPPLPALARPAWRLVGFLTAGLLPERLRREYGLSWDPVRSAFFAGSRECVRRVALPLLPDAIRRLPVARAAERAPAP